MEGVRSLWRVSNARRGRLFHLEPRGSRERNGGVRWASQDKRQCEDVGRRLLGLYQVPIFFCLCFQEYYSVKGKAFRESQPIRITDHGHGNVPDRKSTRLNSSH